MIPLKLSVKNFLCYGDGLPELDLEGIRLACLSGQNGHGKSALLDAITWALWGKARGRTQDELIHFGESEMLVELEFLARDVRYRVARRHARTLGSRRQGSSDLQLQVLDGSTMQPITGNTIRETQAKVDQITGMDYDTFINSAFLLQGRADEFTNKRPGERKEVLAKILGLDYYDRLTESARRHASEKRMASSIVAIDLERMLNEVSREDELTEEIHAVNRDLEEAESRRRVSTQELESSKTRIEDLHRKLLELEQLKGQIPVIGRDISDLDEEIDFRQGRITSYEELIADKDKIEVGLAELKEVRGRFEEMSASRDRFDELTKHKSELERAIQSAKATLQEQIVQLESKIENELRPVVQAAPSIASDLEAARAQLHEFGNAEREISSKRVRLQEISTRVGQLEATVQQLTSQGHDLRSKLNLVKSSHGGARCPLCDTELGPERCESLSHTYDAQIKEKIRLHQENQAALKSAQEGANGLESEITQQQDALLREQQKAHSSIAVLERQIKDGDSAANELERVNVDLAEKRRELAEVIYASAEQQEVARLEGLIGELGYSRDVHDSLGQQVQALQPFEDSHRRLNEAIEGLPVERGSLTRAQNMRQRRHEELSTNKDRQRDLESQVSDLPEWEAKLTRAQSDQQTLEFKHQELFKKQVELTGESKRLEELKSKIKTKGTERDRLREQQEVFQELSVAFGKNGIQALLIERVLPGLEDEANALLGRMTDGRMTIKLETQRERRGSGGDPVETLEIKISDEIGHRSYEMFSGGEAFRINLALRIALSKVLAHRSGAPLPTLFIDEGFGTQDTAGRERVLDVIRAIEEDFEKIIVITHLDDLREAFPARIDVVKEGTGSTFQVHY